jgi:hypothetical protein
MSDYGFDPKQILSYLINTYISFIGYKEFLEYVVKDERSFKIDNFEKVIALRENGKIRLDYEHFEDFLKLTKMLKEVSEDMKSKEVK